MKLEVFETRRKATILVTRRLGSTIFTLLLGIQTASADPAANVAARLFLQVCQVSNLANPDRIRAWAAEHHLPQVKDPNGLAVFVGKGPDGVAWWIHQENTELVLAIRSQTGGCAVYAEPLDPAALGEIYDMLITGYAKKFAVVTPVPDKIQSGPYGTRVGKVRLIEEPNNNSQLLFTLITNERQGGPYQGTLQVTLIRRSK